MKRHRNSQIKQALMACAWLTMGGAGAAAAQSDVTLYGLIDVSLVTSKGDTVKQTSLMDGTIYGPGSRWGLRVTEDLGSGLKTGAVLESGFSAVTGSSFQGGRLFGRQSFVWLRSDQVGELRMGRQYVLHDEVQAAFNATSGTMVINPAASYGVAAGRFHTVLSAPRIDNAVQLISPRLGGFQTKFMYAFGQGVQDIYRGAKLDYASGPLKLVAAYERGSAQNTPASGNPSVNHVTVFGGSYDLTVVKLFAGIERATNLTAGAGSSTQLGTLSLPGLTGDATQLKAFTVGTTIPVGKITYVLSFVRSRYENAINQDVSVSRYGTAAVWELSKRTAIYGAMAFAGGDLKTSVYEKRIGQIGLRHRF